MPHFVERSFKGRKLGVFNLRYESKISSEILNIVCEKLGLLQLKCELIEDFATYLSTFRENHAAEFVAQIQRNDNGEITKKLIYIDILLKNYLNYLLVKTEPC